MKMFPMLNFKNEKLPVKTGIRSGFKFRHVPLANPAVSLSSNKQISIMVKKNAALNPKAMRVEARARLSAAVETVNSHIEGSMKFKGIKFSIHEGSNRSVAVVRDERTGEVLKTIPGEAMLEIAARLKDASGLLVNVIG